MQKIEQAQVEEETDLMSIGDHCNVCQQLDFLPYKCSGCQLHFCSEHRLPASHSCTNPPNDAKEVVVCPVCAKAITVPSGMDPNLAFERYALHPNEPGFYNSVSNYSLCLAVTNAVVTQSRMHACVCICDFLV